LTQKIETTTFRYSKSRKNSATDSSSDFYDGKDDWYNDELLFANTLSSLSEALPRGFSNSTIVSGSIPNSFIESCDLSAKDRRDLITGVLSTVSDPFTLTDIETPQNRALEWLLSTDDQFRCPGDPRLVQRYVTVLFYFSTNGNEWYQCSQNDEECGETEPFIGSASYLSKGNECDWAGLTCDLDNFVTSIMYESNNLRGKIPTEIAHLKKLQNLYIARGRVSGQIPSEIGNLNALVQLDLSSNKLRDSIPEEIYNLSSLEVLDVGNNQLSGTISAKIGDLMNLKLLSYKANKLSGTIPNSFGNLNLLIIADLYGNSISGNMPHEVCKLRTPSFGKGILEELTSDCLPNMVTRTSKIHCNCCSECFFAS